MFCAVKICIISLFLIAATYHGARGQMQSEDILEQAKAEISSKAFASQINLIENQNVGCLFDKGVCAPSERCLDDDLFGTCVATYAESLYFNYRIPRGLLKDLKLIMRGLVERNFTWHDLFTQCCVRAALLSSSMEIPTDLTICTEFSSSRAGSPGAGSQGKRVEAPPSVADADDVAEGTFDSTTDGESDRMATDGAPTTLAEAARAILLHSSSSSSSSPHPRRASSSEAADATEAAMQGERLPLAPPLDDDEAPQPPASRIREQPAGSPVAAALSKRRSGSAFADRRYLWLQFSRPEHLSDSGAAEFVARLNSLAGKQLLSDRFSISNTINNNEAYFFLSPGAEPSEVYKVLGSIKADGKFAWTDYRFGKPQGGVLASELSASWSEQTRVTTTLLVCAVVIAMILALFGFFIVQRFRSSKRKLREMTSSTGAFDSSDYRDLCRQRMSERSGGGDRSEPVSAAAAQHLAAARAASGGGGGGGGGGGSPHSSTGSWTDDPITTDMDITTGHLILNYMENYLSNKEKLEQEWADLCSYEAEQSASRAGATAENAAKNRYQDLLPYDHSRVVLKKEQNATGGDYINASYICDSDPKVKAYVLAQGPAEDTAADFWQMLWETASVTVVNLTGLRSGDGSHELCAQYWPTEGSRLFNKFEVHLVSEHIWCEDFVVRNFYLKHLGTGEARTVTMFHFLNWDEAGLPRSAKALLDFRRKVNKSYKGRASPLVVHCSDGCGRSGTYCLLDLALTRIGRGVKEIDLAASLEHLRDQRPGLVKTKDQFEFVVFAIAEEVHIVLKTLPQ